MIVLDEELLANMVRTARFTLDRVKGAGERPPEAAAVDAAVSRAYDSLGGSPHELAFYVAEASRVVMDGFRVRIAPERSLTSAASVDWYVGERLQKREYWERYRRFLAFDQMMDPTTVSSIDRSSDRIVRFLSDPRAPGGFDRRGLVVGQVQSGKTTSYAAVINKSLDAGYRMVIILAGTQEALRVQTQKRIEETVRGLSTESTVTDATDGDRELPLARIKHFAQPPRMFTTRALRGDFDAKAAHFATTPDRAAIFVIKKNAKVLRNVIKFLSRKETFSRVQVAGTVREEIHGWPLLVIDDEADNASVDTKKPDATDPEHSPSAINTEIRRLLTLFHQSSYVAYTATPYANILIHKDKSDGLLGSDLFPRDFIVMLPSPSNYVGPGQFFGGSASDEDVDVPPLIRPVRDCGISSDSADWMPLGHDKTHRPSMAGPSGNLPRSLEDAVLTFLLATSVRFHRGGVKAHHSMLVHVSRFKSVQKAVAAEIEKFRYELKGELDHISSRRGLAARLRALYEGDVVATASHLAPADRGTFPTTDEVVTTVRAVLDRLSLRVVNSESAVELDYDSHPDGLVVLCVGGDKLSRGLTLYGLTVSYFLRASRMYDTLMQMGRWFGYRPGYKDLCRLFLTDELHTWYEHIARADEQLRAEFHELEESNSTPETFGLRVRSHPHLQVTAPAKMHAAEDFDLDFGGRVTQTIHFDSNSAVLNANARRAASFIESLAGFRRPAADLPRRDPATGEVAVAGALHPATLFEHVPLERVRTFIRQYQFHAEARRVSGERLLEYLEHAERASGLGDWSVLVASKEPDAPNSAEPVELGTGVAVVPVRRSTKPHSPVSVTGEEKRALTVGVLASPSDLVVDLRPEELARLSKRRIPDDALDAADQENRLRSAACAVRDPDHGLLVLYVVQPTTREFSDDGTAVRREVSMPDDAPLPIGLALALPANHAIEPVHYTANSVFVDELEKKYAALDEDEGDLEGSP